MLHWIGILWQQINFLNLNKSLCNEKKKCLFIKLYINLTYVFYTMQYLNYIFCISIISIYLRVRNFLFYTINAKNDESGVAFLTQHHV